MLKIATNSVGSKQLTNHLNVDILGQFVLCLNKGQIYRPCLT